LSHTPYPYFSRRKCLPFRAKNLSFSRFWLETAKLGLALQRLLHDERYAVVRGQGGEGKTALAAEFARWMVRSHQIRRAAFVSVETHSNRDAVLDAIGRQLVPDYSVATFDHLEKAILKLPRFDGHGNSK
jgi:hypothetical protein